MTDQSTENIVSSCSHCGNTLTLPPEYLGKMIKCQKCSEPYTVQADGGDSESSSQADQDAGEIKSRCPNCSQKVSLPMEYLGKRIRCPECSEAYEVKAEEKEPEKGAAPAPTPSPAPEKESIPETKEAAPEKSDTPEEKPSSDEEKPAASATPTAEKETPKEKESVPETKEAAPEKDKANEKSEPSEEKSSEKKETSAPVPAPEKDKVSGVAAAVAATSAASAKPAKPAVPEPEKSKPKQPNRVKTGDMVRKYSDEVSSDSLMTDFKPKGILIIAIFTIIVHVVVLGGTSYNFIYEKIFANTDELNEEQKKKAALADATLAISEIAKKYELTSGDVTSQFSGAGSRADKVTDKSGDKKKADKKPKEKPDEKPDDKPKEKSDLEEKFENKEKGPEEFNFKDDF